MCSDLALLRPRSVTPVVVFTLPNLVTRYHSSRHCLHPPSPNPPSSMLFQQSLTRCPHTRFLDVPPPPSSTQASIPRIDSVSPVGFPYGQSTSLTVRGANFATSGGVTVYFDDSPSSPWYVLGEGGR